MISEHQLTSFEDQLKVLSETPRVERNHVHPPLPGVEQEEVIEVSEVKLRDWSRVFRLKDMFLKVFERWLLDLMRK